jgi:hypothetical protein
MAKSPTKKPETASATLPGGTKVTGPKAVIEKIKDKPAVKRAQSSSK